MPEAAMVPTISGTKWRDPAHSEISPLDEEFSEGLSHQPISCYQENCGLFIKQQCTQVFRPTARTSTFYRQNIYRRLLVKRKC